MESGFYFTALIIGIGAFHLISQVVDHFGKHMHAKSNIKKQTRDDWYVFFHCSDLTGKKETPKVNSNDNKQSKQSTKRRPRTDRRTAARISYT